jgi:hypothetical protein
MPTIKSISPMRSALARTPPVSGAHVNPRLGMFGGQIVERGAEQKSAGDRHGSDSQFAAQTALNGVDFIQRPFNLPHCQRHAPCEAGGGLRGPDAKLAVIKQRLAKIALKFTRGAVQRHLRYAKFMSGRR